MGDVLKFPSGHTRHPLSLRGLLEVGQQTSLAARVLASGRAALDADALARADVAGVERGGFEVTFVECAPVGVRPVGLGDRRDWLHLATSCSIDCDQSDLYPAVKQNKSRHVWAVLISTADFFLNRATVKSEVLETHGSPL